MKTVTTYRLRVTHGLFGREPTFSYIVRKDNGQVIYISGNETPMALSNLVSDKAAETRFELQDCEDGAAALEIIEDRMTDLWGDDNRARPKVEIL